MADTHDGIRFRRLRTPRAAGVAGVLFAALFATSLVSDPYAEIAWNGRSGSQLRVALVMAPFAGIAFLWFIGVVRDRLGDLEDRFFSTVFLGSGLLFLAMVFTSMAIAGGVLGFARSAGVPQSDIVAFGREVVLQINNVYAIRMAAVFMISLGTIGVGDQCVHSCRRTTGVVPRALDYSAGW